MTRIRVAIGEVQSAIVEDILSRSPSGNLTWNLLVG